MNYNSKEEKFSLGPQYHAIEKLGEGTYGKVFKVRKDNDPKLYAVKKIKVDKNLEGIPSTAIREIAVLKKCQHKYIVGLEDISFGSNEVEICLEYMPYDLSKWMEECIKSKTGYTAEHIKTVMYQIISATEFMHSHKILHRDLKPQNILLQKEPFVAKLADFGLSRVYSIPIREYTKEVLTLWYRSPEMILGVNTYSTGLDIWSIGCIFGELYKGSPIFMGDCEIDQLFKMFQVFGTFNEHMLPGYKSFPYFDAEFPYWKGTGLASLFKNSVVPMDDLAMDLLKKLLVVNPLKRISCKEALSHVSLYCF